MRPADPDLPTVFAPGDAVAAGLTERQVRRRASARWDRLRRGQYAAVRLDEENRWRAEVIAAVRATRRPLVLSHAAAARAWRLPGPIGGWGETTFTTQARPAGRAAGHRVVVAPLPDEDSVAMGAVRVTSMARTVVDCARRIPPHDGLAMADAALRRGLARHGLTAVLQQQAGWPGVAVARRVIALADGRRETALESWSAWAFAHHGLPAPVWQVNVSDTEGVFLGRVDCWWEEGVVGEADGALKYRLAAAERGGASAENLAAIVDDERRREHGLRHAGLPVVRWSARDVRDEPRSAALAAVLRQELGRADPRRFTGRAVPA